MPRNLACFAYGREGEWEAFCLDFDLAVQGQSFEQVKEALGQAIDDYVDSALAEDEPAKSQLLARRAPLKVRLMWALRVFRDTIGGRSRNHDSTIGFPFACHA
jgi:predicted RNase H-like HicB family nuclease